MKAEFLALALFGATAGAVSAQSIVTLEDFKLDGTDAQGSNGVASEIKSCLLTKCTNSKFKSSKTFSIDDVVNLGIVDHEDVDRNKVGSNTQALASIDVEILFDYNSDNLRPDQARRLIELASAIKDEKFAGVRFAFIGHADAKGTPEYNLDLSSRRAHSVLEFVAGAAGMSSSRFSTTGRGSLDLKTPRDPFGPANRRVQLVLIPVK